jgi:predicted alpha/beta hydrolase family esterase
MTFVIIPGLDGSDEHHWQSRWEADWLPSAVRIEPSSWTSPELGDWSDAITRAVAQATSPVTFITHSLGCHALAHWLTSNPTDVVRGAFLVAPPDPVAPTFPADLIPTFAGLPAAPLRVPAVLVVSEDDPYCTIDAASRLAAGWSVPLITAGPIGHINSESNLGLWPDGQRLFTSFLAGLGYRSESGRFFS